jgi:glutamyl-Q tRNA(Asp) synthetase
MSDQTYRGRFAPSPTGYLHFGSLVTAVASYLEALKNNGQWLLRIEDVDTTRTVVNASESILRSLEKYGFQWDGEVLYQSQRYDTYQSYLEQLKSQSLIYGCECSRRSIREYKQKNGYTLPGYPAICRHKNICTKNSAQRINTSEFNEIGFEDQIQGKMIQHFSESVGDFVLQRSDGIYSYQLAVVVDDFEQQVTDIVRGFDLFDNTPRQILLHRYLGINPPNYAHIPIATNSNSQKLSKQTFAKAIKDKMAHSYIIAALEFLGQSPSNEWIELTIEDMWNQALNQWNIESIPKTDAIIYQESK